MNFTASYIKFMGIKITDELGHPITTISPISKKYKFSFRKPRVCYDILQGKFKEPEIVILGNMKQINDLGLVIHVISLSRGEKWIVNQKKRFKLYLRESLNKEGKEIGNVLQKNKLQVLYDKANAMVKLIGPLTTPSGEGEWLRL
jgi:hypothetical protein